MLAIVKYERTHVNLATLCTSIHSFYISASRYKESFNWSKTLQMLSDGQFETVIFVSKCSTVREVYLYKYIRIAASICRAIGVRIFLVSEMSRYIHRRPVHDKFAEEDYFHSDTLSQLYRILYRSDLRDLFYIPLPSRHTIENVPFELVKHPYPHPGTVETYCVVGCMCNMFERNKTYSWNTKNNEIQLVNSYYDSLLFMLKRICRNCGNVCVTLLSDILKYRGSEMFGITFDVLLKHIDSVHSLKADSHFENAHDPLLVAVKTHLQTFTSCNALRIIRSCVGAEPCGHTIQCREMRVLYIWKLGINKILDMRRFTVGRIVEEIFAFVARMQQVLGLKSREIMFHKDKGLSWYIDERERGKVDSYNHHTTDHLRIYTCSSVYMITAGKTGGRYMCLSCEFLDHLNAQLKAQLNETQRFAQVISNQLMEVVYNLRPQLDQIIHSVTFLNALTRRAEQNKHFVQPTLNCSEKCSMIEMSEQRDTQDKQISYLDNAKNVFISRAVPFILITGPNLCGKTMFIQKLTKTVQQVLSTCLVDSNDTIDCATFKSLGFCAAHSNMLFTSHFYSDLKKMKRVVESSSNSLFCLDEPCTSTSITDAENILWTTLEISLRRDIKLLLASHLSAIKHFSNVYIAPSMKLMGNRTEFALGEAFRVQDEDYGISQATLDNIPNVVLNRTSALASILHHASTATKQMNTTTARYKHATLTRAMLIISEMKSLQKAHLNDRRNDLMKFVETSGLIIQ